MDALTPATPAARERQPSAADTLTVVIPVLNEERGLDPLLARLTPVLEASGLSWSILFIDDGSTDGTIARIRDLHSRDPRIKSVSLSRNFGKEIAVAAGLRYSTADATVVMDSDLQHPPEVIPEFIAQWRKGFEVVFGQRIDRHADSAWRRLGARVFYGVFHKLSGTELQPRSCDFRLLGRHAVEAINRIGERKRYNNGLFAWIGFPAVGVPFDMPPRRSGDTSRWLALKLARFALDGLASFSTIPLRVWSILGLHHFGAGLHLHAGRADQDPAVRRSRAWLSHAHGHGAVSCRHPAHFAWRAGRISRARVRGSEGAAAVSCSRGNRCRKALLPIRPSLPSKNRPRAAERISC